MTVKTKNLIVDFATSSFLQLKDKLTCGFELETQESDGKSKDDVCCEGDCDREIDHDRASEAIDEEAREHIDQNAGEILKNHVSGDHFFNRSSLSARDVERVLSALEWSVYDFCENSRYEYYEILDEAREYIQEDFDYSDYQEDCDCNEDPEGLVDCPRGMEVKTDQSVNGFEFITRGAKTYDQFIKCANDVFKIDHEVDTKCSFHIHLQVKGIRHNAGPNITKALTEYILCNQDQLPESVKERFQADDHFFEPNTSGKTKFSFVHCHPQGTWEYRCFGNVTNAADAKKCLDVAIKAMRYAYRKKLGVEKGFDNLLLLNNDDWTATAKESMKKSVSMDSPTMWNKTKAA